MIIGTISRFIVSHWVALLLCCVCLLVAYVR